MMKLKPTIDDLDMWYQEHMRMRNSPNLRRNRTSSRTGHRGPNDRPLLSSQSAGQLCHPSSSSSSSPSTSRIFTRRTFSTSSSSFVEAESDGRCSPVGGSSSSLAASASAAAPSPPALPRGCADVESGGRPSALGSFLHRLNRPAMKKSDAGKIQPLKNFKKGQSKSPSLPKKQQQQPSPDTLLSPVVRVHHGSGTLHPPLIVDEVLRHSTEDLDMLDTSSKENGGSIDVALDEVDAHASAETSESNRVKAAIEHLHGKIEKTKEQIKTEQAHKEANVNEYLRLAANTDDKQQSQRIKTVFEKRNQKSAQGINQLQKKLENYQKKLYEIETRGLSGHKHPKERLRGVGQGLKDVGANIVDGITGFSGGVVDNIKGAKDSIVSKPKEFAHLIKNRFGSADNINQLKMEEGEEESRQPTGGTLPASFKYGSDDEGSSITSGSGFGAHSSPHSTSQNTSQQLPVMTAAILEPIFVELEELKELNKKMSDQLHKVSEEYETYKTQCQSELVAMRGLYEEEKYKVDRQEDQINDLTELHQNEITNLKQDITSMEEKIEYRLDERTTDLSDLVDNCQTRIQRLEQQQQQQQILSMEMVENVTFRTLLTKLINVVLALLAVVLVFVSTAANLLSPFLTTRMRILSTVVLAFAVTMIYQNLDGIEAVAQYCWGGVSSIWTWR